MVAETLIAAEKLEADGISCEVINMHTIKPIDKDAILKTASKTGKVITLEEHSVIGGLGSAVAEVLSENLPTKMKRIGVNDVFGQSADAKTMMKEYKLDADGIYSTIKEWMK